MKIVSHTEPNSGEVEFSLEFIGGKRDGMKFHVVQATMDDGSFRSYFLCDSIPGYFKQVMVPWDMEHDSFINT